MRIIKLGLFFLIAAQQLATAKVLDKTVAIIDDRIITLSYVNRIISNWDSRAKISGPLYSDRKKSQYNAISLIINSTLIRDHLKKIGFIVDDQQVEDQIKNMQNRFKMSRKQLIAFLKSEGLEFTEYFELLRETNEYNIFLSKIVNPLISISDQEIKNQYYKLNSKNKALSFKYDIVDFYIPVKSLNQSTLKTFTQDLKQYQNSGILPAHLSGLETTVLGEIREDGISAIVKNTLKNTDEGEFSKPVKFNSSYHSYFVKKKELIESSDFLAQKNRIRRILRKEKEKQVSNVWFKRESNSHFVKIFLKQ